MKLQILIFVKENNWSNKLSTLPGGRVRGMLLLSQYPTGKMACELAW